jgi:iron complex outermembrane receptor protein
MVASASNGLAPNPLLISSLTGKAPGTTLTTADGYTDSYFQKENTEAFFTDETWTIVQGLDLTLGARWTHEEKSAFSNYHNTDPAGTGCAALFGPALVVPPAGSNEQKFLLGYGCYTGYDFLFNGINTNQGLTENNADDVSGGHRTEYLPGNERSL